MARPRNIVPVVRLTTDAHGTFSCYWTDSATSKVVRRGCGTKDESEARKIADQRFQEWRNPPPPAAYTVGQLLDQYIDDKTDPRNPQRAVSPSFLYNLKHIRPFFTNYTAAMLTPDAWNAYRAFRGAHVVNNAGSRAAKIKTPKPVKDSTIKRELNALRGAIIWGRKRQWIALQQVEMVLEGFGDDNAKQEFLSRAEFDRLLAALKETPHLQLFSLLSVATAGRMSAVLGLKWTAVTFGFSDVPRMPIDQALTVLGASPLPLVVRTTGNGKPATFSKGLEGVAPISSTKEWIVVWGAPITFDLGRGVGNKKTGSGYVSPDNVRLYQALSDAYRNRRSEYVIEWRGKGVKSVDLSDAFERANIPKAKRSQHILKHTCCSWLRRSGAEWRDMADLTGTSEETLKRHYAHIAPDNLRRMSAALAV